MAFGGEGGWTDCFEVNRYVRHEEDMPDDTRAVLDAFDRWPTWMWANWEGLEFVDWLREYNADRMSEEQVGFYGLDGYSLYESMAAVVEYLRTTPTSTQASDLVRREARSRRAVTMANDIDLRSLRRHEQAIDSGAPARFGQ